jgi:hypothetical protein
MGMTLRIEAQKADFEMLDLGSQIEESWKYFALEPDEESQ